MMLEVEGLGSHYGRIPALKGIDLHVGEGELVALVGANGAGKTTLLRALSGVQPVSAGRVRFEGADITAAAPDKRVRLGIVQVPEGRQVFAQMAIEHERWIVAMFEGMSARDKRAMNQLLSRLRVILRQGEE